MKTLALSRKEGVCLEQKETESASKNAALPEATNEKTTSNYPYGAVHLLSEMQKEGRLVDFLQENLEDYNDEEIGVSVRSIHEGCKKVLNTVVSMEKVIEQEEESTVRINKDYDAKLIKLTGRVSDTYPMKGSLVHPGWKVKEITLTKRSEALKNMIAPAEVEVE